MTIDEKALREAAEAALRCGATYANLAVAGHANPQVVLALLDKIQRMEDVVRRFEERIDDAKFDALDILNAKTLTESERLGFLDGVSTVLRALRNAIAGPRS